MSIELSQLISAFLLGLLGGAHCLGMCGGIMAAISLHLPKQKKLPVLLSYNTGRITSYTLAGMLVGSLGWSIQQLGPAANQGLRWLAGILLILMACYIANWWKALTWLEQAGQHLWRYIQPLTKPFLPATNSKQGFCLGILWGWLPCGLIYSALTWSAASGNTLEGGLLMLGFGLGTLPTVLATGFFADVLKQFIAHHLTRTVAAIFMIGFGIWTIPGPHQALLMPSHNSHAHHH
ncbi:sulfite exporter TauE/SafE family protein [Spartinivicinus poritis]|uniref:Sulfite exporter TauE/SafE family protein n=1 Tax=Spartinivicinus poritis TaxID=2994640 RepID=A0ABT5UC29_9GAMM|nr:sulfite exporter TauE/SafE family protein [Spartinivicinus sp. A2-2]MDE1463939.1 sulfite exporter TauE/SafE family protein [Spartinivicinus sp. A2-2]